MYLSWLVGQCIKRGVVMKRGVVKHVADAADFHHSGRTADIIINCTGLSARKLGGVKDEKVYPARGQIVVVRNDPKIMASISGTDDGPDESTYIMHRAAGRVSTGPVKNVPLILRQVVVASSEVVFRRIIGNRSPTRISPLEL